MRETGTSNVTIQYISQYKNHSMKSEMESNFLGKALSFYKSTFLLQVKGPGIRMKRGMCSKIETKRKIQRLTGWDG